MLREHKRKEQKPKRGSGAQIVVKHLMGDVVDNSLKEELGTWKHILVDSEMENGRHRVYNFVVDTLDAKYLLEKLDNVFDTLKCAAEVIVAFGLVLEKVEYRSCRYYYAHEKKYWRDLNLWLLQKTWQKPRIYQVNSTSLILLQEN